MSNARSKKKIVWPTDEPILVKDFLQTGVDLLKEKIGALSQDSGDPLSRVCVANSCFSLEPVRGCPLACAYCIAGNDCRNLVIDEKDYDKNINEVDTKKIIPRRPEVIFPGEVLAEAMVDHPGFIKNKSIVSVAIGSSEAFLPGVEQETWAVMKYMADNGFANPFWLAVKYGINDELLPKWQERFGYLKKKGIKVLISVSESSAPEWLEPYQENRFRNLSAVAKLGVHISLHLRPIIRGITDSEEALSASLDKSLGVVESVCVGGLRVDPGIVLLWKHINDRDPELLPNFAKTEKGLPPKKDLPDGIVEKVHELIKRKGYDIPVYIRSSNALSLAFGIPDVNLYDFRNDDDGVLLMVPLSLQAKILEKYGKNLEVILNEIADQIGLGIVGLKVEGEKVLVDRKLNYQEHRLLIHSISHSGVLFLEEKI